MAIQNNKGSIRIRIQWKGSQFSLSGLGRYGDTQAMAAAAELERAIKRDLRAGLRITSSEHLREIYLPSHESLASKAALAVINRKKTKQPLLEIWDQWVDSLDLAPETKNNHYYLIRQMILKNEPYINDVKWFKNNSKSLSPQIWKQRLSYLKRCYEWAIEKDLALSPNPYKELKLRKDQESETTQPKIKPFTQEEIKKIIYAFETDQFRPKQSAFPHSHYTDLVKFLLTYGCRIGEALGLWWSHVNFEENTITIEQALKRDISKNPNSTKVVIGKTKTYDTRILPITNEIKNILTIRKNKKLNSLVVFSGYKTDYLSPRTFRKVWKKVLTGLNIEYRYPYQIRHTALSKVAKDHGLAAAAALAGHKDLTMVSKHYVKHTGDLIVSDLIKDQSN